MIAQSIVDLITKSGLSPEEAFKQSGMGRNMLKTPGVREAVKALIVENHLPADIDRAMVRAVRRKILLAAQDDLYTTDEDGSVHVRKDSAEIALKAANQIAGDPEVGLQQPPATTITLDIGPLRDIINRMSPITGFRAPSLDDVIIDVEEEEKE